MRDLFTRLVEQTLGHVKGVEPVIASRFAPGRASFQWPEVKTPEDGIRRFEGREGPAVFPKPFFPLPGEVERISSSMARSPTDLQAREEGEETPALVPDQSVHSDKKKKGTAGYPLISRRIFRKIHALIGLSPTSNRIGCNRLSPDSTQEIMNNPAKGSYPPKGVRRLTIHSSPIPPILKRWVISRNFMCQDRPFASPSAESR